MLPASAGQGKEPELFCRLRPFAWADDGIPDSVTLTDHPARLGGTHRQWGLPQEPPLSFAILGSAAKGNLRGASVCYGSWWHAFMPAGHGVCTCDMDGAAGYGMLVVNRMGRVRPAMSKSYVPGPSHQAVQPSTKTPAGSTRRA